MGFRSNWFGFVSGGREIPKVTWALLKRVFQYAFPYRWQISIMLILILLNTGISLLSPLILKTLIDTTIPERDLNQLVHLAVALLIIPIVAGAITIVNRRLTSQVAEGVTFDLRMVLYRHLQRMSLRFFTNTRVGELMSRLNNDVLGAQTAISSSIIRMVTNIIQTTALFIVMMSMEWRMTIVSVFIMPIFVVLAKFMGKQLRKIAHETMDAHAKMNATMNETLNISGAMLVKLFGRRSTEIERFKGRAEEVRDIGIRQAMMGASFFAVVGLISAVSSAFVYGVGGYLVISKMFTIGTIVAFGAYLGRLYGSLQGLASAPVEFATSMVSFERVFEINQAPNIPFMR